MSNPGDDSLDASAPEALRELEAAVHRTLERVGDLERLLQSERARCTGLEELLWSFQEGEEDPAAMKERLEALQEENADMKERLQKGREAVERLLARIRFLEDQR
ncbi:MAG: hypothetical protein PVI57_10840 [Gemmatimonadota bacterium]